MTSTRAVTTVCMCVCICMHVTHVCIVEILKIHAQPITKYGEISYENLAKLSEGFNGADLRNICTEAGMFAIRSERDYVMEVSAPLSIFIF